MYDGVDLVYEDMEHSIHGVDDLVNDYLTSGSCSDIDFDDSVWYWRARKYYIERGLDIKDEEEFWTGDEYEKNRRMLRKNNYRNYE